MLRLENMWIWVIGLILLATVIGFRNPFAIGLVVMASALGVIAVFLRLLR